MSNLDKYHNPNLPAKSKLSPLSREAMLVGGLSLGFGLFFGWPAVAAFGLGYAAWRSGLAQKVVETVRGDK